MDDVFDMEALRNEVIGLIRKPDRSLKNGKELYLALKARLTKKELGVLIDKTKNIPQQETMQRLHIDKDRYEDIVTNLDKKLNNEKVKQSISQDHNG